MNNYTKLSYSNYFIAFLKKIFSTKVIFFSVYLTNVAFFLISFFLLPKVEFLILFLIFHIFYAIYLNITNLKFWKGSCLYRDIRLIICNFTLQIFEYFNFF